MATETSTTDTSAGAIDLDQASSRSLPHHYESRRRVNAPAEAVFAHLDDHSRLSAHMSQSSLMMAGSRMEIELDAAEGRAVGSRIRLEGRVLGIALFVDEVVTEHDPPVRKVWETIGKPRLLVIGHYRMGYEITPQAASSMLRVFIDYAPPATPVGRLIGALFGGFYARWCTQSMADEAAKRFPREQEVATARNDGDDEGRQVPGRPDRREGATGAAPRS